MDRYSPLSMIVEVDGPSCSPNGLVLRGPGGWRPALSRRVFHETVHYWQHISQAYLARLVEEDWERLQAFRAAGEVRPVGPRKRRFLTPDPEFGFSPRDLIECLARFWDVHTIGAHDLLRAEMADPRRDVQGVTPEAYARLESSGRLRRAEDDAYSWIAYELAMDATAGRYAEPYRRLRNACNSFRANTIFPIVGHLAMHSADPVRFLVQLSGGVLRHVKFEATDRIETSWRRSFETIFQLAQSLAAQEYGGPLLPAPVVVERGPLKRHPGYQAAKLNLTTHIQRLAANGRDRFLLGDAAMNPNQRAGLTMDYMLACCGVTDHRAADVLMLTAPPLVRFADGGRWILQDLFQEETDVKVDSGGINLSQVRRQLARSLEAIERDWRELQLALTGY